MIMPAAQLMEVAPEQPSEHASEEVLVLTPDLDADTLDLKLRAADRRSDVGHREVAFYLAEMHDRGLHQMLGYSTTIEYACTKLEMGRRQAQDLIAAGRALNELPLVDEAFCAGRLRWSRVRLLIRIAVPETESAWLERALELSWREFDREIATSERGRPPRKDRRGLPRVKVVVRGRLERVHYEAWEIAKKKLEEERCESLTDADCMAHAASLILGTKRGGAAEVREALDDSIYRVVMQKCPDCERASIQTPEGLEEVDPVTAACIECDAPSIDQEDPDHEKRTPPAMRKKVLIRDGLACRICRIRSDLMAHHIVWASRGGPTEMANLLTLDGRCHALVHEGLIVITGTAPNRLTITDRKGRPLDGPAAIVGPILANLRAESAERKRVRLGATPADIGGGERPASAEGAAQTTPAEAQPQARELTIARMPGRWDAFWFAARHHLFKWNESRGEMDFKPGLPMSAEEVATLAATQDDGETKGAPGHRPARFADVIGQPGAVRALSVAAKAARKRKTAVDHVLLLGPAGLGKTTLAEVLANEIGTRVHRASGALIQDPGALLRLLTAVREKDVLFIDETHALPRRVIEFLYEAMEDRTISLTVSDGHAAKAVVIDLPAFTLVAATTEIGKLPEPFVSRFPIREHLAPYGEADLSAIVARTAVRDQMPIDADAAQRLASVARGVPRHAIGLFKRVRNEVLAADATTIDVPAVVRTLEAAGLGNDGLYPVERQAFEALARHGRPMGLTRWAAATGLPAATLRQLCEPELLRRGLIGVTPRGREVRAQLCAPRPARRSG